MADFIITCPACSGFLNPDAHPENIKTLPYNYMLDGIIYEYSGVINSPEVFEKIAKGLIPDISSISIPEYINFFTPILNSGKNILHIDFSESYSPNCKYVREAANGLLENFPERKIRIIDSKRLGLGIFAIANEADKLLKSEKSFDETYKAAQKLADNNLDLLIARDLKYLKSKKYISSMQKRAALAKHEEIILKFDKLGNIVPLAKAKRTDGTKKVFEIINANSTMPENPCYIACEPAAELSAASNSLISGQYSINSEEPEYIQAPDIFTISKVGLKSVEVFLLI